MTGALRPDTARVHGVRAAAVAVAAVFFVNGFHFSSWAARLPAVRDALGFSESQMGVLLLFVAAGAVVALPLSGIVVEQIGAVRSVAGFTILNAAGMVLAATGVGLGEPWVVRAGLILTGIGTAVWDSAMNIEGAVVERALGRAIMPRFHAMFSFGTVAGAGVAAVVAWLGVTVQWSITGTVVVGAVAVCWAVRFFLPSDGRAGGAGPDLNADPAIAVEPSRAGRGARAALTAWTEPRTLLIGVVVLAAALTEGAANDWVGLAVVDGFHTKEAVGALALATFLTAMTGMRLLGTGLLDRFGRVVVLRGLSVVALAGLALFTTAPWLPLALVGVVCWGLGAALGFPVGMSAASDEPARAAVRVSVIATIGYTAFLAGPPLIGVLASAVGYRHALAVIAVPIVVGLLLVPALRPPAPADRTATGNDL